ncbi:MAG: hypothetical protein ACREAW_09710 [Nitrososphaera sp.]
MQGALGAMHGQTNTQSNDTADNETSVTAGNETAADNMTVTAEDNATITANATDTGNETTSAESNETSGVNVTITPIAQRPGGSALVHAEGLDPDNNATIKVDGELAATTQTDENGTLFYALGVPSEPITRMTIEVDDSGEETITNETHAWEGTVSVIVEDQAGNRGSGELTVLAPVDQSNQTSTAGVNITRETLDRFLD